VPFPKHWLVGLFLPSSEVATSGTSEREFFEENTPIAREEVLDVLAAVYHGVLPAIATCDLSATAEALASIQRSGFKRREVLRHPATVGLLTQLQSVANVAAGMSSMGPMVYVIAESADISARMQVDGLAKVLGARLLGWYEGRNVGRTCEVIA
jgi:beta-ribofuranosylaminobenzene 5'-phosphate synthase